jgi:hypothetical protein
MYQEMLRVFVALGAPFELEAWGKVPPLGGSANNTNLDRKKTDGRRLGRRSLPPLQLISSTACWKIIENYSYLVSSARASDCGMHVLLVKMYVFHQTIISCRHVPQ